MESLCAIAARPAPRVRDESVVTQWALAARAGNRHAAEQFFRAVQPDVRRYVAYLTGDAQAAEDLAQETLLRAVRSLPGFEGRSSARAWLLSIARRTVVDRVRYERSRPRVADTADWLAAVESTQRADLPGFEEGVALGELLSALPWERKEAFLLTQVLGLPYAEAALAAGCPVGTVRSRVARARATLLSRLATAEYAGATG